MKLSLKTAVFNWRLGEYGARVTESVDYHVTCRTVRSSFSRERETGQVSCWDDLRDNP